MDAEIAFRLDPAVSGTLTQQVADNLRQAIANGVYKPGDKLPGVRQLARSCGTSIHVSAGALRALVEEGIVKARPRIGCIVLGRSRSNWHGRVLLVHVGAHGNYNQNVFLAEVSNLLEAANWRTFHAFIPRSAKAGAYDLTSFRKTVAEKFDLCLLPSCDPPVIDIVRENGIPYMLMSAQPGTKDEGCVGFTARLASDALAEFLADCRAHRIRTVLNVGSDAGRNVDIGTLRKAGIRLEDVRISPLLSGAATESFASCAYAALLKRLVTPRAPRPDLIYFDDDYIARGGLWALAKAGLRVPQDVKVVSLANRDHAPFYPCTLARFECNPFADASKTARAMLRFLRTGRPQGMVCCTVTYVRGKTF